MTDLESTNMTMEQKSALASWMVDYGCTIGNLKRMPHGYYRFVSYGPNGEQDYLLRIDGSIVIL